MVDLIMNYPAQCLLLAVCAFGAYPILEGIFVALHPTPQDPHNRHMLPPKGGAT